MVSYEEVSRVVASNHEAFHLPVLSVPKEGPVCEWVRLPSVVVPLSEDEDNHQPSPPVLKAGKRTVAPVTSKVPVAPVIPPAPAPSRPSAKQRAVDPLVLGIELSDPLYEESPARTRHQIECEEGVRVEAKLNDLYKSQGGRSRGWTKVALEGMIKPRCASGGNLKELDNAKRGFLWPLVRTDKPTSSFLDFLCVAKGIRVAVWFEEDKQVIVYPAADNLDNGSTFPLYHVTDHGVPKDDFATCQAFLESCDTNGWVVLPPASILHSLEGLTLAELESVGTKLGMTDISGNKATRVAKIAVFKLRQRLS
jgi:hypothetical protein